MKSLRIQDKTIPDIRRKFGPASKHIWNSCKKGFEYFHSTGDIGQSREMTWYKWGSIRAEAGYGLDELQNEFAKTCGKRTDD